MAVNPFARNQNIADATKDHLYKIANKERRVIHSAVDSSGNLIFSSTEAGQGIQFAGTTASVTIGSAVSFLRNSMAKSLTDGKINVKDELRDVNAVLKKYNIHTVDGNYAQIASQLHKIMNRSNCPPDVKAACKKGILAAKYGMLSSKKTPKIRILKLFRRTMGRRIRTTELGKGAEFAAKVLMRIKMMIKTGLKVLMLARKAALFAHLKAEALRAKMAARKIRKNPMDKKAREKWKNIQDARKKRRTKRKKKEKRQAKRRNFKKKFRKWANDPIGLKRGAKKIASRLLRTKVGRAASLPFRILGAVKRALARAIVAIAMVISQVLTILLLLGLLVLFILVIITLIIYVISSIVALFDFTTQEKDIQDEMFKTIRQCYEEQVQTINDCYSNYEHVTVNRIKRRTDSVYKDNDIDIEETTNAAEIISMANVYFDFELEENKEDVIEYIKALYEASNPVQYDVSSRVEDTGEVDADGNPIMETYYDVEITVTTYYFNDIFQVSVFSGGGGVFTGDMSGLPAWITPEAVQAALEVQQEKDIPAAAILGQMILESGGGSTPSGLCSRNNNCLGIKGHKCQIKGTSSNSWGTTEYYGGKAQSVNANFQVYKTLGDCIRCYGSTDVVSGQDKTLNRCTKDPKTGHFSTSSYVTSVWQSGYATSPEYVRKVMKVVRVFNLERFNYMSPSIQGAKGTMTGVQALISCADYYCNALEAAVSRGEKWVYSNDSNYVKQTGSFEQMLNHHTGIRGGNCATIANWAFRDIGIIQKSEKFYGDGSGKIRHYNSGSRKLKVALDKNCYVIEGNKKKFSTLVNEGKIIPGDVIMGVGHTFVYRGDGVVYASGHDAYWHTDKSVKTDDRRKAVFEKWIRRYKGTYDENFRVHYILRIKESFVPAYYRDANGKLIKNK